MSFVSLALGVLGLIMPLFSTLAIVTGIAGFIQIHRIELKGRWMALTGIILGVLGIILFLLAILFGIEFVQSMIPTGSEEMLAKMMTNWLFNINFFIFRNEILRSKLLIKLKLR